MSFTLSEETCIARTSRDILALRVRDQGDATQPLSKVRRTGKAFVVYEMSRQVLPTAPSPTTTHLVSSQSRNLLEEHEAYLIVATTMVAREEALKFCYQAFAAGEW